MANRQWLKGYLGSVLELDSPILEAINENAFKPQKLNIPELVNYIEKLVLNLGWIRTLTGFYDANKRLTISGDERVFYITLITHFYSKRMGTMEEKNTWTVMGEKYYLGYDEYPYKLWIQTLERYILE